MIDAPAAHSFPPGEGIIGKINSNLYVSGAAEKAAPEVFIYHSRSFRCSLLHKDSQYIWRLFSFV